MTALNSPAAGTDGPVDSSALECLVIVGAHHGLHLSIHQIVHDNALSSVETSLEQLVHCARKSGLKAKSVRLDWNGLSHLRKALPAIVRLKNGANLVLVRVQQDVENAIVVLRDPKADEDALLTIDRICFEGAWTGEVVLLRRNYDIVDEEQPFSFGLITTLIFRERRLVRDLVISAMALSLFALAPIMFWRLLSDKVMYYHSMSTFTVLCLSMGLLIVFEAVFTYLRSYLLLILTSRIDIRLSEYMFEKVLRLPIDYFERNQVGMIARDMNEIWRIRNFLTGQLFGTMLDSLTLLVFLPVMFAFSPLLDDRRADFLRADRCLATPYAARFSQTLRRGHGRRRRSRRLHGADAAGHADGQVAGAWKIASGKCGTCTLRGYRKLKQRRGFHRGADPNWRQAVESGWLSAEPMRSASISRSRPTILFISARLFAFLMLSQRVAGPLMQMAQLGQSIGRSARQRCGIVGDLVNQPAEEGHSESRRAHAAARACRILQCALQISGRRRRRRSRRVVRGADRSDAGRCGTQRFGEDNGHAPVATASFRL